MYWDEDSLRLTVVDDGVEHDLYETPFAIDEESDEFQEPFYLIANLAIGGAFTDAYNLGDPGSGVPVSMPFPAEMYVDYIRVYEWNGQGEVHLGPPDFAERDLRDLHRRHAHQRRAGGRGHLADLRVGRHAHRRFHSALSKATTSFPGKRRAWDGSAPASCPSSR